MQFGDDFFACFGAHSCYNPAVVLERDIEYGGYACGPVHSTCTGPRDLQSSRASGHTKPYTLRTSNPYHPFREPDMVSATSQGVVHLNPRDNICVATRDLVRGTRLHCNGTDFTLADDIRLGHKIATQPIGVGQAVRKYGQTIGFASVAIAPGEWVHVHNLAIGQLHQDYASASQIPAATDPHIEPEFPRLPPRGRPGRHA